MYEEEIAEQKKAYREREQTMKSGGAYAAGCDTQGSIGNAASEDQILDALFKYHRPNPDQAIRYENLRAAAKAFAKAVCINVPRGTDQAGAIVKIREAVMTANAGVALNGVSL